MAAPNAAKGPTLPSFVIPLAMFVLGLLVQGTLYAATVRDDIHDLKRDMAEVRCTVALYTHATMLPSNCIPGRNGENAQWKEQP
jgi:hypothetical protein